MSTVEAVQLFFFQFQCGMIPFVIALLSNRCAFLKQTVTIVNSARHQPDVLV